METITVKKRIQIVEPVKEKGDGEDGVQRKRSRDPHGGGIMGQKESSVSSRSSSSLKYYKNLLREETSPKEIDRVNIFGIFSMLLIMGLIVGIYFLTTPTIDKYRTFAQNGDFPSRLLVGYSLYASEIEILLAINNLYIPEGFPASEIEHL